MSLKIIALFVCLLAICCEKSSGQGRPFYRPVPLIVKQIIPEGSAWPASDREYTNFNPGNSVRDILTTTTRQPNQNSPEQSKGKNVNTVFSAQTQRRVQFGNAMVEQNDFGRWPPSAYL